jgi:hypothetical protein
VRDRRPSCQLDHCKISLNDVYLARPGDETSWLCCRLCPSRHRHNCLYRDAKGFSSKLKKSLCGLKQSPLNHFNNLSSKLKTLGFESCDADPCLFVLEKCICLVYVDDTLMFAQTQAEIESIVKGLKNLGMDLEEEDSVSGFLGVLIQRHSCTTPTI